MDGYCGGYGVGGGGTGEREEEEEQGIDVTGVDDITL